MFSSVIGHPTILRLLSSVADHPAHGYLFEGPEGVGKALVAERFARLLLKRPLERSLDAHPDFVRFVREEGAKELTVKRVREYLKLMQLTTAEGGRRVALVDQAERLNEEAANAMLKAVEEPPPSVVYLFVTSSADRLPATLRSRLVRVTFQRVPSAMMHASLEASGRWSEAAAALLSRARGCPGRLNTLLDDPSAAKDEEAEISALLRAFHQDRIGVQSAALERAAKFCESAEDAEAMWRRILTRLMAEMETLFAEDPKKAMRVASGLIHAWFLAGTSLSPRLGLEWNALKPYIRDNHSVFSFLNPSYL